MERANVVAPSNANFRTKNFRKMKRKSKRWITFFIFRREKKKKMEEVEIGARATTTTTTTTVRNFR